MKVTPLNQFRELQILWLFPARSSDTGTAGTGIEILASCSARPLTCSDSYNKLSFFAYWKAQNKILIGREERQAVWLADLAASCLRSRSDLVGLSGSAQSTAQLRARRTAVGAKAAISEQIQQIRRTGYPAHSLHCQDKTKVKGGRHQHGSRRSTPATPSDFGSPRLHWWL